MTDLTQLRAEVAMRAEDTRIARKHADEAAARSDTDENVSAWKRAERWLRTCAERERQARVKLIATTSSQQSRANVLRLRTY